MRRLPCLLMVVLLAMPGYAQWLPDDHGDTVDSATLLPGREALVSGTIEHDVDRDVFAFSFLPGRSYLITLQTGTVWDLQMDLLHPSSPDALLHTNTAWQSGPHSGAWSNSGAAARWQIALSGLFSYTTGSYQLGIAEVTDQDTDDDGVADAWEMAYFTNLTSVSSVSDANSDGFSDLNAYLAGLSPYGAVALDSLARTAARDTIAWHASAFATYEIYSAASVTGVWVFQSRQVVGGTGGTLVWTNEPGEASSQFYRLDFFH